MSLYYGIENDPRQPAPVYDKAGLPACKARARRLSAKPEPGETMRTVYILAEKPAAGGGMEVCGQIVFSNGRFEYSEGEI